MSRARSWTLLLLAVGTLVAAFAWIFSLRLASGDVYPPYSSLRADPLGTRAFYEALEGMPEWQVSRDFHPLHQLPARARTVLLPGADWREWQFVPARDLRAMHAAVSAGARVVVGFSADVERDDENEEVENQTKPAAKDEEIKKKKEESGSKTGSPEKKESSAEENKEQKKPEVPAKDAKSAKSKQKTARERDVRLIPIEKTWGVALKRRWLFSEQAIAEATAQAPAELEREVAWHSDVYFVVKPDDPDWRILYRRGGEAVVIEKTIGQGTLVLVADSFCLSNEALQEARATGLLAWLIGAHREVVFHEGALGVLEENGVGALARRYGLGGALALVVLLGGMYAWRRLVAFKPTSLDEPLDADAVLSPDPGLGLTSLLRRSLARDQLVATCVAEWQKSRRSTTPADARLAEKWKQQGKDVPPAVAYNALADSLKRQ